MPPEQDRGGSVPLLGLEPATTEIIEELGSKPVADSFESSLNPLLGTNAFKTNNKSSQARSSDRVCYGLLLRFGAQNSGLTLREIEKNSPRGCYGFSHGLLPRGMFLRGGRFYLRRHVPTDIQPIIGRAEVWRSLKTDSLQTALRRLPLITAALESEFERIRHDAGLTVDETILRPSQDDLSVPLKPIDPAEGEVAVPCELSLAEAYARYMDDPTHRWSSSTRQAYETTRKFAVGIIGSEVPVDEVSRAHCRDYLDALRFMPRNASKRLKVGVGTVHRIKVKMANAA